MTVAQVLTKTDWAALAEQKRNLLADDPSMDFLDGLVCWIDAIQDAAELEGYPVVFLTEDEENLDGN